MAVYSGLSSMLPARRRQRRRKPGYRGFTGNWRRSVSPRLTVGTFRRQDGTVCFSFAICHAWSPFLLGKKQCGNRHSHRRQICLCMELSQADSCLLLIYLSFVQNMVEIAFLTRWISDVIILLIFKYFYLSPAKKSVKNRQNLTHSYGKCLEHILDNHNFAKTKTTKLYESTNIIQGIADDYLYRAGLSLNLLDGFQ